MSTVGSGVRKEKVIPAFIQDIYTLICTKSSNKTRLRGPPDILPAAQLRLALKAGLVPPTGVLQRHGPNPTLERGLVSSC